MSKKVKIKISSIPPGFAPEHIREQWLGVVFESEGLESPSPGLRIGTENLGGYKVLPMVAIQALKDAGKIEAANFWRPFASAPYFVFNKDVCTLL